MASEIARKLADNIKDKEPVRRNVSSETFTKDRNLDENKSSSSSSYILANDCSQLSRNLDRWITINPTESAAVQHSRIPVVQRSVLATTSSLDRSGMWYLFAMVLPICTLNTCPHFGSLRYLGAIINTVDFCIAKVGRVCSRAHAQIQQLAHDQVARELFATAMDVVLVIYAIGFLILSMYQASLFR